MSSKEISPSAFYTHQTDLRDITQPTAILNSLSKALVLRIPQDEDLQPLINVLANPENTKDDLSVSTSTPEERESICRQWLTLNDWLWFECVGVDWSEDRDSIVQHRYAQAGGGEVQDAAGGTRESW